MLDTTSNFVRFVCYTVCHQVESHFSGDFFCTFVFISSKLIVVNGCFCVVFSPLYIPITYDIG